MENPERERRQKLRTAKIHVIIYYQKRARAVSFLRKVPRVSPLDFNQSAYYFNSSSRRRYTQRIGCRGTHNHFFSTLSAAAAAALILVTFRRWVVIKSTSEAMKETSVAHTHTQGR
jgi:hypothetical protein